MDGGGERAERAGDEAWLRLLIAHLPATLWTTDCDLRITTSVGAGLARRGIAVGELVGRTVEDLFGAESLPVTMHRRALRGESVQYELTWQGRTSSCMVSPLRDATGAIGCIGLALDVTEREERAGAIALSEQRMAEAQRIAHVGSWEWDILDNRVTWSDELYRIYGLDRRTFGATYEAFLATSVAEDVELVQRTIGEAAKHPGPFELDHRVVRSDGSVRTLHTVGQVLVDPEGHSRRMIGTCHDVTEERDREVARQEALSLLRATLESTADGILVVDLTGRVVTFNHKFAEMWRLPRELLFLRDDRKLVDHVLSQLADPDAFLARVEYLYAHLDEEATDLIAFRDGRTFERWTQAQRLDREVIGRIWSFRDVTARLAAEKERDRLLALERGRREQAEDEVQARNEFLSVAAHELRTPITSLQLSAQSLLGKVFGPLGDSPLVRPLRTIERQTRRLTRLVNDLLDISRLDAGRLDLNLAAVDLAEVARAAALRFDEDFRLAHCSIALDLEPAVGRWDLQRLDQVVTNLLSNAIRYGAGRPIAIRVRAADGRARLTVEDRGAGIAPDRLPHIFDRFERGDASHSFGGLGLGLYIAHGIVERLGGTLAVESELGHGSAFTVELPLAGPR